VRLAVTGNGGQLARALVERAPALGHEVVAVGRAVLDLATADDETACRALAATGASAICNAAAYTAVDRAESEPELALAVNATGAGLVARAAARLGLPLVHISTDYVFSGDQPGPYGEEDATGPTGVYGASKLAGEAAVRISGADAAILRTAWVYSPFGANFVRTMLRLAATRAEVGVVADQHGCPTSALDLADAVLRVAANLVGSQDPALRGTFHAAGTGEASWAELAQAVFAASAAAGGPTASVRHITTADYPTPARRPANSRLDCGKLALRHGISLPDWRASVADVSTRLVHEGAFA
jgi:dTDP-4-dehydrorhamnose reductase